MQDKGFIMKGRNAVCNYLRKVYLPHSWLKEVALSVRNYFRGCFEDKTVRKHTNCSKAGFHNSVSTRYITVSAPG